MKFVLFSGIANERNGMVNRVTRNHGCNPPRFLKPRRSFMKSGVLIGCGRDNRSRVNLPGLLVFTDNNIVDGLQLFIGVVVDNDLAAFAFFGDVDARTQGLLKLIL